MSILRLTSALMVLLAVFSAAVAQAAPSPQELCDTREPAPLTLMQFEMPEFVLEPGVDYRAILCTSAGAIYVDLYEKLTPQTVNNFIFLARQGYYDSTSFHRVIPNFMAQAGDPTGTGRGGPGYQFGDEPVGYLVFDRPGLLAMANAGPGTNGSQFFITTAPTPHLNHKHTIFGDVLVGAEVVETIRERDPATATQVGETLRTVLVISDLATVDNSAALETLPAQQDAVLAAFEAFRASFPPSLPSNPDTSGSFDAQQISAGLPEGMRSDFLDYAESYGHDYRYRVQAENVDCEPAIYFSSLGYQVDIFADAQAAIDALSDPYIAELMQSQDYEAVEPGVNAYLREVPTCADEAGWQMLALYTTGRYLVALDVLVGQAVLQQAGVSPQALLANLSLQIEPGFSDIFRREIR